MTTETGEPHLYRILAGEAAEVRDTPYGAVGTLFSNERIEAVWISKQGEAIDPGWFSQETVDLILVVQGQLRVEFADPGRDDLVMHTHSV